jgi:tRNA1Val (adenine37-N6)-methyltransferase
MRCLENETLDELFDGSLRIIQARDGYRSSLDPVLLCAFSSLGKDEQIIDLGTGNAVIPLILAGQGKGGKITGIDCQSDMVDRSQRSVLLNGLEERIEILQGDIRDLSEHFVAGSFNAVVTNPPYRVAERGRVSPYSERAAARHELTGGLVDFLLAASFLLKRGGRFFIVYLAERLPELMSEMRNFRLEPKRMRMVHSRCGSSARMVLVEGRKNGKPGVAVEAPLIVYQGEGRDYTAEVLSMYK